MEIIIDWQKFGTVFGLALVSATLIVSAFAIGVRLLTNAQHAVPGARKGKSKDIQREVVYRVLSYVAFAVCVAALLYGLYDIIPYFDPPKN
jgi:uncharacterized membrane protein SpoIIM required for sporulation